MKTWKTAAALVFAAMGIASLANRADAATLAMDDASKSAYDNGSFDNGDNGGFGWGSAWTLSNSGSGGWFVGSSANNGDGGATNINTGGRAWGLWANSGGLSQAYRNFDGALSIGQTFTLRMDNGWIDNGGTVGFNLRTAGGERRFGLFFSGGSPNYKYADSAGDQSTSVGFTDDGLTFSLTLTGTDTYTMTLTRLDGSGSQTISGTLAGTAGGGIGQVEIYNSNAGFNGDHDAYFNSIATPEPASLGVLVISAVGVLSRRRRTAN